jgi:hypothetical protein
LLKEHECAAQPTSNGGRCSAGTMAGTAKPAEPALSGRSPPSTIAARVLNVNESAGQRALIRVRSVVHSGCGASKNRHLGEITATAIRELCEFATLHPDRRIVIRAPPSHRLCKLPNKRAIEYRPNCEHCGIHCRTTPALRMQSDQPVIARRVRAPPSTVTKRRPCTPSELANPRDQISSRVESAPSLIVEAPQSAASVWLRDVAAKQDPVEPSGSRWHSAS